MSDYWFLVPRKMCVFRYVFFMSFYIFNTNFTNYFDTLCCSWGDLSENVYIKILFLISNEKRAISIRGLYSHQSWLDISLILAAQKWMICAGEINKIVIFIQQSVYQKLAYLSSFNTLKITISEWYWVIYISVFNWQKSLAFILI